MHNKGGKGSISGQRSDLMLGPKSKPCETVWALSKMELFWAKVINSKELLAQLAKTKQYPISKLSLKPVRNFK